MGGTRQLAAMSISWELNQIACTNGEPLTGKDAIPDWKLLPIIANKVRNIIIGPVLGKSFAKKCQSMQIVQAPLPSCMYGHSWVRFFKIKF